MSITVSRLIVYPVKSMAGIALTEAELTPAGIRHDRSWMVVDGNNRFLTQRQHPEMALVTAMPDEDGLTMHFPDGVSLRVPIIEDGADSPKRSRVSPVTVWNDTVDAVDQGDEAAGRLTRFLKRPARLVYISKEHPRKLGDSYTAPADIHVGFADSSPLHLTNEASLSDLNKRLERPVSMDRFRPNIVVSGTTAFEEDRWQRVQIGDVTLMIVKPCIRCQMINVNQQTGIKEIDPLETLGTYRSVPRGIGFGQKVVHEHTGIIRVGDSVDILEVKR